MGHFFKGKEFFCLGLYVIDAGKWHTETLQAVPWGRGRVGSFGKAQLAAASQGKCLGWEMGKRVWGQRGLEFRQGRDALSCGWCTQGPAGLLGSSEQTATGKEPLEFFGGVGFVYVGLVCLFVPSAALAQGSTI